MTKPPNDRVPFDSPNSEVIWTTVIGHRLSFPNPCCSFPPLTTPTVRDSLLEFSMLFQVHALYVSDLHLPSLCITRSEMSPPAASVVAPPICNECKANSSGLRPDSAATSWAARGPGHISRLLRNYQTGTRRGGRDQEHQGSTASTPT